MSHIKFLYAAGFALFFSTSVQAETLLVDSFESGDMSATNEDGFDWGRNNRTSVVTHEASVYNNREIYNEPPGSPDWSPFHGDHSLRFRYPAGEYMAEQRFNLGSHYQDVWLSYWVRVPTNFKHGSLNNKFLSVWPTIYDRSGTVTWQTRPDGLGGANLVYQDGGVTSGETGSTSFISVPEDRGRWMHIVARIKAASGPDAHDGIIQLHRRWEGGTSYELIHEKTTADTWDDESNEQGISQGYIMGWANDAYDVTTEWLLDKFSIHTSSPIEDFSSNASQENRPNPPILDLVN